MTIYRPTKTAEEYRQMAYGKEVSVEESFERCDTDGFLSQWASGQTARIYDALADLVDNGGMATFTYLADLEGNLVNAKAVPGKFGTCWMILDSNNKATGEFVAWKPARKSTLAKRGYQEVEVEREAVVLVGDGNGINLSVHFYPAEWLGK